MVEIFRLMLTRLSTSKTENLTVRFVRLFHFMAARAERGLGTDYIFAVLQSIQVEVFKNLYSTIILPETPKLSRPFDRKIAVISLVKTLASSKVFAIEFTKGWGRTADAMLQLMLNPPLPPQQEPLLPEHDVEDNAFGVGYTQLNSCRPAIVDPYPEVQDLPVWVSQYLKVANGRSNGQISKFVQERCSPEAQTAMLLYLN